MLRIIAVDFTHLCVSPRKELLGALRTLLERAEQSSSSFLDGHEQPHISLPTESQRWPQCDPPLAQAFSHIINNSLYMQTLSLMVDEDDSSQPSAGGKADSSLPQEVQIAQQLDSCLWRKLNVTRTGCARCICMCDADTPPSPHAATGATQEKQRRARSTGRGMGGRSGAGRGRGIKVLAWSD